MHILTQMPEPEPQPQPQQGGGSVGTTISGLVWTLAFFFAVYLSFKCDGGVDILGLLGACCCTPCYIAYKLTLGNCFLI
jgi:hypothetical protein